VTGHDAFVLSETHRPHVVVVGAGISGCAAAYFVRQERPDVAVTVLDSAPHVGGKLRVAEVAGFPVDVGAEAMLARRPEAVDLAREVGLGSDLRDPVTMQASVWFDGRLVAFPARTVMGVPGDISALAGTELFGPGEIARMGADRQLGGLPLTGDAAIGQLVAERLGQPVLDRLVEPLLGGVYAGHADRLSLDATAPELGAALRTNNSLLDAAREVVLRLASASTGPVFAGIDGGVGRLPASAADASGAEVRTGATVRDLTRTASGRWRLLVGPTVASEVIEADAVVVAVPATPAARLLSGVAPDASRQLAQIDYASVAIVTLAYRTENVAAHLSGSGFLVPPSAGRLVKGATYSSVKWAWLAARHPGVTFVRGSVGRHGDEWELQRDDADLVAAVATELGEAAGFGGASPIGSRVTRWGGALPQYAVGHRDRVAAIRTSVASVAGLSVAGAAYDGLGIAACIASARDAATQALAGLSASATMGA